MGSRVTAGGVIDPSAVTPAHIGAPEGSTNNPRDARDHRTDESLYLSPLDVPGGKASPYDCRPISAPYLGPTVVGATSPEALWKKTKMGAI